MSQTTTHHKADCRMAFGRKDPSCPRCVELFAGAEPRQWSRYQTWAYARGEAVSDAEIRAHFDSKKHRSGQCGPVCTFGEW